MTNQHGLVMYTVVVTLRVGGNFTMLKSYPTNCLSHAESLQKALKSQMNDARVSILKTEKEIL